MGKGRKREKEGRFWSADVKINNGERKRGEKKGGVLEREGVVTSAARSAQFPLPMPKKGRKGGGEKKGGIESSLLVVQRVREKRKLFHEGKRKGRNSTEAARYLPGGRKRKGVNPSAQKNSREKAGKKRKVN